MPGCNQAFRPDQKLDVNTINMLTIFITSLLTTPRSIVIAVKLNVAWCQVKSGLACDGEKKPLEGRLLVEGVPENGYSLLSPPLLAGQAFLEGIGFHDNGFLAEHGLAQEAEGEQHEIGVGAE